MDGAQTDWRFREGSNTDLIGTDHDGVGFSINQETGRLGIGQNQVRELVNLDIGERKKVVIIHQNTEMALLLRMKRKKTAKGEGNTYTKSR